MIRCMLFASLTNFEFFQQQHLVWWFGQLSNWLMSVIRWLFRCCLFNFCCAKCWALAFLQYFVPFLVLQSSRLGRESRLLYFFVFLMLCRCYCSLTFPHGAMGWSIVCYCGIYWLLWHTHCFIFLIKGLYLFKGCLSCQRFNFINKGLSFLTKVYLS